MSSIPIFPITPTTSASVVNFSKDVSVAGTQVSLFSSTTPMIAILVVAKTTNTGLVFVGDSSTENAQAGGVPLAAGKGITMFIDDGSKVYLNSAVGGEGVTGIYYTI